MGGGGVSTDPSQYLLKRMRNKSELWCTYTSASLHTHTKVAIDYVREMTIKQPIRIQQQIFAIVNSQTGIRQIRSVRKISQSVVMGGVLSRKIKKDQETWYMFLFQDIENKKELFFPRASRSLDEN